MALSNGTRHRAEAVTALLLAARASIDATLATLEQASRLASQDEPEGAPTPAVPQPAPPVSRRPRSPKRVRDASATPPVVKPEPAAPPDAAQPGQLSALEHAICDYVVQFGVAGVLARAIVERATSSTSVKDHGAAYSALKQLVERGILSVDGRRYRYVGLSK